MTVETSAQKEILEALRRIPDLAGRIPDALEFSRLAGLTNRIYKVSLGQDHYVVRLPGKGTDKFIDRRTEAYNARLAARAGINAEVLYFSPSDGTMLTRFLGNAVALKPVDFKDLSILRRAAATLKTLHRKVGKFQGRFEIFAKLAQYRALLEKAGAELPGDFARVMKDLSRVKKTLAANPPEAAPCHCDPVPENFISCGGRMYLIDWEYSGMGDPQWDLGDLSAEAGLDEAQDEALLAAYYNGALSSPLISRMTLFKPLAHLLWTVWGLFQSAHQNGDQQLRDYGLMRFERCKDILGSADFGKSLEAAA